MTNIRIFSILSIAVLMFVLGSRSSSAQQEQQDQTVNDEDITVTSFEGMGYPVVARVGNREGVVVVRVKLDHEGKVVCATAVSGYKALIRDSLANARKWRFRPNAGKTAVIIYEFRLAEGECGPPPNQLFVFREPNIASVVACAPHWQPSSH